MSDPDKQLQWWKDSQAVWKKSAEDAIAQRDVAREIIERLEGEIKLRGAVITELGRCMPHEDRRDAFHDALAPYAE